ncbi:NAD(P)/FAD-dependent oxidoreductase [Zongyangia hominis]|uniref:NAD(P)/FAD-dependent oxidoreductase n=1 Tax=Zongyangia hominis TaxID=2763677 RepID=A0A926EDH9_9FIRM|nr:FAD-dependent oxidoreductase [Zongyangia hominis]MBC8570204.1 NAD(P)/FAD-dependent oxidoreductase [Zongyangia hominis]
MKQYVIIGNGIAAAGCIEGIRSIDTKNHIVVVSKESHTVYCRPLISYYLEGKTTLDKIGYRSDDFYKKYGCEVLYNETAIQIDDENKGVLMSKGGTIPFSELCVATGSSPFVPSFDGLNCVKNRFSFMTLDDTFALEKAISPESRVLIIGAGLIGLKCAEGLHNRVKNITVCDLADKILSSILDDDTAPMVQKFLEMQGVDFCLSDRVARFDRDKAIMKSGKVIDFDVLVTAVGVRANTTLVAEIGGKVNRGIVVNDEMRTSLDNVYAAGDCTEGFDISLGGNRVLALLPNAYMQGFTAGVNMAGGTKIFDNAIPMNSIGFFGLHIMTAGSFIGEKDGGTVYMQKDDTSCKKFFVRDGLLKGYILVDKVERGGIYTSLIREQTPLETVDFDLLKENASFMAFSSETRRKKFGGVV